MLISRVKVNPSISVAHEIVLKEGPAIYAIHRVECKSFIISSGNPSLRKDKVFNGLVSKSSVFGLVDGSAWNGDYHKNLYNFRHFNLSSVEISVNDDDMMITGEDITTTVEPLVSGHPRGSALWPHNTGPPLYF